MAPRFTRAMRAATSPYGMYTDPPIVAVGTALSLMAALAIGMQGDNRVPALVLAAVALGPLLLSIVLAVSQLSARAEVVDWLAGLPFAVENMNGLLNGVADRLSVRFLTTRPDKKTLSAALEAVHEDCFVLEFEGDVDLEVELKIGVLESKYNPSLCAHRRYRRVRQIVDRVLVPMAADHPIEEVRIC